MFKIYLKIIKISLLGTMFAIKVSLPAPVLQWKWSDCLNRSLPFARLRDTLHKGAIAVDIVVSRPETKNLFNRITTNFKNISRFASKNYDWFRSNFLYGYMRNNCFKIGDNDYISEAQHVFTTLDEYDLNVTRACLFQAAHESLQSKIPNIKELLLVNRNGVTNNKLLDDIPYCGRNVSGSYHYSNRDGSQRIIKKKFLIHNNSPVGWIYYSYRKTPYGTYDSGYIDYVGVAEKYRGRNYGAYLMNYALHEMKMIGVSSVELFAANDKAAKFHEKMGFEAIRRDSSSMQRKISQTVWPFTIFA